jgi:rhamnose transport system ATP-binding protein
MSKPSTTIEAAAAENVAAPVLMLRGITKAFGGNRVLHDVDLDVRAGQVHALVGENGAGKSTLMKIAAGVHRPDSGEMLLGGQRFHPRNPSAALGAGIAMVHQELSLAPDVSVAENIFVGREPCRAGLVDWSKLYRRAADWLLEFCLEIDPAAPVSALGIGYRQVIEILKALAAQPRVIIFDEPTSSLEAHETAIVLQTIRKLARRAIGVVYISHRMDEIFAVADCVTVLRDGRRVLSRPAAELTRETVVNAMVGRELSQLFPPRGAGGGAELLRVEHLTRHGWFRDVSFTLRRGEVLGFSGLVGAGRTELMRALFGADAIDSGSTYIEGHPAHVRSVPAALAAGIAYLPEERKTLGLFGDRSVEDNIAAASLRNCSRAGLVRPGLTEDLSHVYCARLDIKLVDIAQDVGTLSGGNQQKVLLARWLATGPTVLIVDEPTRGVDVGAKGEIHRLLRDYANAGHGVIVVSSEMPELLGLCDRIIVLREGTVSGEVPAATASERDLINLAVAGRGF